MRRVADAVLACLPLDDRSRRAVNEALADWALEHQLSATFLQTTTVFARSLASLARTLLYAIGDEVTRIPAGWLTPRIVLLMALPLVPMAATGWGHVPWRGAVSWQQRAELGALVLPQGAIALLPLALFVVMTFRSRDRVLPPLGIAAVALAAVLAAGAWLVPAASWRFHQTVHALQTTSPRPTAPPVLPGPPDLSPVALVAAAVQSPAGPPAAVLLTRTGVAIMAAAFVLLGCAAARLVARARRFCAAFVIATYGAALVLLPSEWELGGHAPAVVGLLPWIAAALAATLSFTIGRSALPEGDLP